MTGLRAAMAGVLCVGLAACAPDDGEPSEERAAEQEPPTAFTSPAHYVATHGDEADGWHTFRFLEGGNPVCFAAASPASQEGAVSGRDEAVIHVTRRPAEQSGEIVSVTAGYQYAYDSVVDVQIGEVPFRLFTYQDTAWAPDRETESGLIRAMRYADTLVIRATSSGHTATTDTYSLVGFPEALKSLRELCP